jgi:hypothetical protein
MNFSRSRRNFRLAVHLRGVAVVFAIVVFPFSAAGKPWEEGASSGDQTESTVPAPETFETISLTGRVVWLEDALERRYGIRQDRDVDHRMVALESTGGEVWPILKDSRGRAFHQDDRLLGRPMELLVRRFAGSPIVQVIRIHTIKPDDTGVVSNYELDYWCDICSIVMYELKDCECCQGLIRIRERLIGPVSAKTEADAVDKPGE